MSAAAARRLLCPAIVIAVFALVAIPSSGVADAVTDRVPTWVPDGEVKAVAVSGSTAYIGGNFSRIAPYTGSSALFDGSSGELRKPWPEVEGVVNAVAPDGTGGWYLGGDFSAVGGVPRTDLAHVRSDGTLDPGWAPTTNGQVRALAVGTGTVFAGGEFSAANGVARGNLAGFTVAAGGLTDFDGRVFASGAVTLFDPLGVHRLLLIGSTLYAVGEFDLAQGASTPATRLRGAAFSVADSQIQAWNPSTNRLINGLARDSDGTDVFIGGRFSRVNVDPGDPFNTGQSRSSVAKVGEGAGSVDPNWVAPLQPSSDLTTLLVFGTQVYIAGTVRVSPSETWPVASLSTANSNAGLNVNWHPLPPGGVQSLAGAGSTVYIGSGSFTDGPQPSVIGVDATNFPSTGTPSFAPALGHGRQQLPSGQSAGVRAIGVVGSDVVVGGTFINVGGANRRNLAAIDLRTGRPTAFDPPMRGQFSPLTSVSALALTDDGLVWAGGDFITEEPDERAGLAAFDAGSGAIASFHRDPSGAGGISALVASGSTVYAAGSFTQIGGVPRRNVAALRNVPGEQGTVLPFDPDVDGAVRALALAGDTLYLGGSFGSVNGSLAALKRDRRNLAAVDSTTGLDRGWDPDADSVVRALAIAGDTVFAGGEFGIVNRSTPRQRLAAFDASGGTARAWAPSADAPVHSLAVYGPTVFAGGDFANVNGVPRGGIAALDAQTGASGPLNIALSPEERGGPQPPVVPVDALFASPQAGLLAGGSFVMRSPTPPAANLAAFGLPPLPPGGAAKADEIDPDLALTVSRSRFGVGRPPTPLDGAATASKKSDRKKAARGTTLRLRLSEPAHVRFELLTKGRGRRVGKRCVKPTRANDSRKRCVRLILKGAFDRSAPGGGSKVPFSGRIARRALKPGGYVLRATPTDAAGNTGKVRSLSITIVP